MTGSEAWGPAASGSANGGLEAESRPAPPVTDLIVHSSVVKVLLDKTRFGWIRKICSPAP